ncbi:MAG: OmpH family outer membrane protein [Bacteroidota bacterium]|nr:OmpH family outer membrane protein [Bacteroidota bacterium]
MKKFITLVLISTGIFGFSNAVTAQKIGYISADEIIQLMPEASNVQTQLDSYQKSLYQNAQDKQTALNESVQKFYKDSSGMSASLKEVKRTELQKQVQDLSGEDQKIQNQFEQKRQELSLPIQKKLQAAIEDVAKENGYTYVLPREALIIMPPSNDIGPLVRKKLGLKEPTPGTVAPKTK